MATCGTDLDEKDAERNDSSCESENDFNVSESEEEIESETEDDDDDGDDGSGHKKSKQEACKYYNQGKCKKGADCEYLHMCQYYLSGNCKYGSRCKYRHGDDSDSDKDESHPESTEYQWQISNGEKWLNITHDWLLEAQYSLPGAKGITIYNTKYGKITIDFIKMRVLGKDYKVRRKTGKNDKWRWYFRSKYRWIKFGKKDSSGNPSPVTSEDVERNYQKNRRGSYQFTLGQNQFKINFSGMTQINLASGKHRKIRRRPLFTSPKTDAIKAPFQKMNISGRVVWQYKGDHGQWHEFKQQKIPCEAQYKQNPQGSMTFSVGNTQYMLDFATMTQKNLTTGKERDVRRITK